MARVITIEGVDEGQPIPGKSPYFGTPQTVPQVKAEIYQARTKEECVEENRIATTYLSSLGAYAYFMTKQQWR